MTEQYTNNPLHSLKLEVLLTELVDFYGWEILAAALNFNCFKLNPTIKGSLKFLRKTEWARHKLEGFYLYRFKNLPRPDDRQFALAPRDRIIPEDQKPKDPIVLTLEGLAQAQERKEQHAQKTQGRGRPSDRGQSNSRGRPNDRNRSNDRGSSREDNKSSPYAAKPSDPAFNPWGDAKKVFDKKNNNDES